MESDLLEFSKENQHDEITVKKFEEAHDLVNAMIGLSIIVFPILYFAEGSLSGYLGNYGVYYTEIWASALGICFIIWYLARRARKSTDLTREELSIHYFCLSVESYSQNEYEDTSEYLNEFESYANKSSNGLFTDSIKSNIEDYIDQIEEDEKNKELLDDSFEEFARNIFQILSQNDQFDDVIQPTTEDTESVSSRGVIAEGAKTLPFGWSLIFELLVVALALVVFFYYNENLGMLLAVSLLTIIPRISKSRD